MRLHSALASMTELILIAVMGGIGTYSFQASNAYENISRYGELHNLGFIPYLPLILWVFISGFGVLSIILLNRGGGAFTWLVIIFSLPSLLAHNTMDWLGIIGLDIEITTRIGFNSMLALGILTITGYVILNYLRFFKESERSMAARQAAPEDIENINGFSNLSLFSAIWGALAAIVIVTVLARGLEGLLLDVVREMPWNIVFTGLFCFLLLAFYLYWLSARRRDRNLPPDKKLGNFN